MKKVCKPQDKDFEKDFYDKYFRILQKTLSRKQELCYNNHK